MAAKDDRPLRPQDLVFFGATTASVTHELKNVLTIINEGAGLLGDLAADAARRPLDPARVAKMSQDVSRNVARAVDIIDRLNRFAHSVDEPAAAVDLTVLVGDVAALAKRFASGRNVEVAARLVPGPVPVRTWVFGLKQAVMGAIQVAVLSEPGAQRISVELAATRSLARIEVARGGLAIGPANAACWALVQDLTRELGGTAGLEASGDAPRVVLSLPTGA